MFGEETFRSQRSYRAQGGRDKRSVDVVGDSSPADPVRAIPPFTNDFAFLKMDKIFLGLPIRLSERPGDTHDPFCIDARKLAIQCFPATPSSLSSQEVILHDRHEECSSRSLEDGAEITASIAPPSPSESTGWRRSKEIMLSLPNKFESLVVNVDFSHRRVSWGERHSGRCNIIEPEPTKCSAPVVRFREYNGILDFWIGTVKRAEALKFTKRLCCTCVIDETDCQSAIGTFNRFEEVHGPRIPGRPSNEKTSRNRNSSQHCAGEEAFSLGVVPELMSIVVGCSTRRHNVYASPQAARLESVDVFAALANVTFLGEGKSRTIAGSCSAPAPLVGVISVKIYCAAIVMLASYCITNQVGTEERLGRSGSPGLPPAGLIRQHTSPRALRESRIGGRRDTPEDSPIRRNGGRTSSSKLVPQRSARAMNPHMPYGAHMPPPPPNGSHPPPSNVQLPPIFGNQLHSHGSPGNMLDTSPAGAPWFAPGGDDYGFDDDNVGENDVGNGDDGAQGGRDPKRRRIARACDMCRKKKIKCDGKMPKCSHCENYKTECIFTQQEKKRAPPKGAKYIEGLENRLGRMESLLRMSGMLNEDDGGKTDLGTLERRLQERQSQSHTASPSQSNFGNAHDRQTPTDGNTRDQQQQQQQQQQPQQQQQSPQIDPALSERPSQQQTTDTRDSNESPFKRDPKDVDSLADQMCSLITNNCGETRYIGSSSGFSIFSPKGIQWVNEKTGDNSFQQMIASATSEDKQGWDHWKPEVFNDLFQRRVFKPLPERRECEALLKDYFEHFNQMFPLFHEPTFMHLVDRHYSENPYEGSGWWASLNVALAIAHRLRVMSNVVGSEEDETAWLYLKNAMAVMTELVMRNTDLLSVQALLGMALFLQGTPNPQPSFFLVAAAMRLAHSIGLHKRGSGFNLNQVEDEQRKRVFWIAYLLDKDICLRSGRPPAQDDDDMNVELPSEEPPDGLGNIPLKEGTTGPGGEPRKTMNLFRLNCTFAQIQSKVYKQLYSVKASRQSDGELLNTIGELDTLLEAWKDSIPLDFRPEHEINALNTPLILHVVVLHFAYYNCLTTIHRMSVHHGYWTSRLSDYAIQGLNARPLNPRVFMSAALAILLAHGSYYARARSDLKLMASVVSFLTMLERDVSESNGNVRRMLSVCSEFERIAKVVLDKAESDMRAKGSKRKAGTGQTQKEAERALRDRNVIEAAIAAGLEEGKTLEQIQAETQAAYRRPVQTPSLKSAMNSGAGASPASFAGSQNSGSGRRQQGQEIKSPTQHMWQQEQQQQQQRQQKRQKQFDGQSEQTGPWQSMTSPLDNQGAAMPGFGIPGGMNAPAGGRMAGTPGHLPSQAALNSQGPSNFNQPQQNLMDGFGPDAFPPNPVNSVDSLMPGDMNGMGQDLGGVGGSFQQPFVPQDLWQMPMTLEWDWAEGLGLGSFTPGGMMGGNLFGDAGGYMDPQQQHGGGGQ
ncbi:hypothetical protein KC325_g108 [Hortaea werneckii]|nr:hypothetical protein KC325_g108 [Hortaea werneckii]